MGVWVCESVLGVLVGGGREEERAQGGRLLVSRTENEDSINRARNVPCISRNTVHTHTHNKM